MKKKCYISGQITGLNIDQAKKEFWLAEGQVRELGFEPINPFEIPNGKEDPAWLDYMKADVKALADCEAIYMLKNWRKSEGAKIELQIAHHLELNVLFQHRHESHEAFAFNILKDPIERNPRFSQIRKQQVKPKVSIKRKSVST